MSLIANRYQIIETLGQGGMGIVYKAHDRLSDDIVALKQVLLAPDHLEFGSTGGFGTEMQIALAQEFRTLASLRHPNIISVLDYGFDADHRPFLTMDLIEDPQNLLAYGRTLVPELKIDCLLQVLHALSYLHRRGILHRDVKPQNIMVGRDAVLKVTDFGLAVDRSEIMEIGDEVVGSIAYMAPEILQSSNASIQSDLYAVGVMAYELLVGKHPFAAKRLSKMMQNIYYKDPDTTQLDQPIGAVLHRILAKSPHERYQNADEVIRAICDATNRSLPGEAISVRESFLKGSKFIGREAELQQLQDALEDAQQGRGSLLLIGGESGIGKSRLLEQLRIYALVKGMMVLRGQEIEDSRRPFQLWRDVIHHLALVVDLEPLQRQVLQELDPELGKLLREDIPPAPELTRDAARERLAFAIADVFRRYDKPLLVLLEDLHWSVEALEPLKLLQRFISELPVLIVGSYRSDEKSNVLDEIPDARIIALSRFDDEQIAELSLSILGETGHRTEIVDLLKRESEGNAFFMIEVIRELAENAGRLADISIMTIPAQVLAGGVQEIVRRRLRRIPEWCQVMLQVAAVAGRQLNIELLETIASQVLPAERSLQGVLSLCVDHAILELHDQQWQFAHDKIRETVLLAITPEERCLIHEKIARAIETSHQDMVYDRAEELVLHWHQANNPAKALEYLPKVIDRNMLLGAMSTAQTLMNQGEIWLGQIAGETSHLAHQRLLYQRGQWHLRRGDWESALSFYKAAEIIAQDLGDDPARVDISNGQVSCLLQLGRSEEASTAAQQALDLACHRGYDRGIVQSLISLGSLALYRGQYDEARHYWQQSLPIQQANDDPYSLSQTMNNLGIAAARQGQYDEALKYFEESLRIRRKIGDRSGIATSLNNLGGVLVSIGHYAQAQHYWEESLVIQHEIGNQSGIAMCLNSLGLIAQFQDKFDEAQRYYQESLEIKYEIGDRMGIASTLTNLGVVEVHQRRFNDARLHYEQSLAIQREVGDQMGFANNLVNLGRLALRQGHLDEANSMLYQGLKKANEIGILPIVLDCLAAFALLMYQSDAGECAVEWAVLVINHESTLAESRIELESMLPEWVAVLGAESYHHAHEQGKMLELDAVVREILDKYGD